MNRLVLAIGALILVAGCSEADLISRASDGDAAAQYELSVAYREGKDLSKDLQASFKWLKQAAAGGHVLAQYDLGKDAAAEAEVQRPKVKLGVGMAIKFFKRDYKRAAKWFQEAANQDHAGAQYELARLYFAGWGVDQDDAKATEWAEKANAQGYGGADVLMADISSGNRPKTEFGALRANPHGDPSVRTSPTKLGGNQ